MKIQLNKVQMSAVNQTEGSVLVLAGAGSGKTRVLTHRVAKLIEKGVLPKNILALTFTNKASNEMKERIDKLCGLQANGITIGTFHSVCLRILMFNIEKIGYKTGFAIYDADDSLSLIKKIFKNSPYADCSDFNAKTIKYNISNAKNDGYCSNDYLTQFDDFDTKEYEHEATAYVFEEYERLMLLDNALDFDDLLLKTIELFEKDKSTLEFYQRKFQYIMVDEYQDTNEVQYRIVKMLSAHYKNIFVVGDDDQSIYGWRGANIENIYNFEKDFKNTKIFKLEQNYRSHQKILDLSNAIISENTFRKEKVLYSDNKKGEKPTLYVFSDEYAESKGIARICIDLKNKGENLNDIAVIYRTNAQSRLIEQALVENSIPSKNLSGRSFYERREIKDLLAYLNLIVNRDSDVFLSRIINVPKRKIGNVSLNKLSIYASNNNLSLFDSLVFAPSIVTKAAAASIVKFKALLDDFIEKKDILPLNDLLDYVFIESGLKEMYLKCETMAEAQARIENIEELIKSAAERELRGETLEEFLYNISLITNMERENNDQAVSLMTMHSAKGLEYKTVIIAGVVNGVIPHTFSSYSSAAIEEERRLLYVGITRAMENLFMTSYTQKATRANGFYETTFATISNFLDGFEHLYDKQVSSQAQQTIQSIRSSENDNKKESAGFSSFVKPSFASSAVSKNKASNNDASFELNDAVYHDKFGEGVIQSVAGSGDSTILTIKFDSGQTKKLFAGIAPIKKL